jgi:hypothetical protein
MTAVPCSYEELLNPKRTYATMHDLFEQLDEVQATLLLHSRYRRFLRLGYSWEQALLFAVGLAQPS